MALLTLNLQRRTALAIAISSAIHSAVQSLSFCCSDGTVLFRAVHFLNNANPSRCNSQGQVLTRRPPPPPATPQVAPFGTVAIYMRKEWSALRWVLDPGHLRPKPRPKVLKVAVRPATLRAVLFDPHLAQSQREMCRDLRLTARVLKGAPGDRLQVRCSVCSACRSDSAMGPGRCPIGCPEPSRLRPRARLLSVGPGRFGACSIARSELFFNVSDAGIPKIRSAAWRWL